MTEEELLEFKGTKKDEKHFYRLFYSFISRVLVCSLQTNALRMNLMMVQI